MHFFFNKYFILSIAVWVQTSKQLNNFIVILFFYIRLRTNLLAFGVGGAVFETAG